MANYGLLVESEIVNALNEKKYKDINNNLRTMLRDMYGVINEDDIVLCKKTEDFIKPDISISINDRTKYVSIKSGRATTMHAENIKEVVLFFRSLGLSKESQKLLLLYHYGDGTMTGTGVDRLDYHETFNWLRDKIIAFNEELNNNKEMIKAVIERVLFQGVNPEAQRADYIYQGDVNYGIVISRRQILKHMDKKTWNFYENVHIGPLLMKPHAKYAHKEVKDEKQRQRFEFYWPKFEEDVRFIHKRYNQTFDD